MQRWLWAPNAEQVTAVIDGVEVPAWRGDGGWWRVADRRLQPGCDYQFRLNGAGPLPDPRSEMQPYGVHGPSRIVDHQRFCWTDQGWQPAPLSAAVIYELHVGTFSRAGTFDGVIDNLEYLASLGVTHLQLMPVCAFPGEWGWGYDGVCLFAPHTAYGGPDGLKRLVNAAHGHGLAVLLDVVYNHLGPDGNYLAQFGPYFTDAYRTPWGEAVNLDGAHSHEVRRFFIDNARMWLRDYHIDGLRLDAVHAFHDRSAVHFLEELGDAVHELGRELGRHVVVIAESDLNDPKLLRPREAGGFGLDAQWSDDFHHAIHAYLTGERQGYYADFGSLEQLATSLRHGFVYRGQYSHFRRRPHGRSTPLPSPKKLLCYIQNHDQVGNRARGERLSSLVCAERYMTAATLMLTSPFIPMIFQGEEWYASSPFRYFTAHTRPELAEAVRRGRRQEFADFGWSPEAIADPQDTETFQASKLVWDERHHGEHERVLKWYASLVHLRRNDTRLHGTPTVQLDTAAQWIALRRAQSSVVCHFGGEPARIAAPDDAAILAASSKRVSLAGGMLSLPPHSAVVLAHGGHGAPQKDFVAAGA